MTAKRIGWVLSVVNIALLIAQLFWVWLYGRDIALLLACASGDVADFQLALALGANPNARTSNGTTALMLAADSHWIFVYDLLNQGADVNSRNRDGETALYRAVRVGDVDAVDMLLKHGADPNIRVSRFGVTPLMIAARDGRVGIVKLLLDHGADPTIKDTRGFTVLQFVRPEEGGEQAKITALIKQKLSTMGNR